MRTFLIAVLLAGVAAPALAARPQDGDRGERSERSATQESSPKQNRAADRPQRSVERRSGTSSGAGGDNSTSFGGRSRTVDAGQVKAVEQVNRRNSGDAVRPNRQPQQMVETGGDAPRRSVEPKMVRPPRNSSEVVSTEHSGDTVRNWRSRERETGSSGSTIEQRNMRRAPAGGSGDDLVQSKHPTPRVFERGERRISRTPMRGTEPPAPRTATAIAANPARHWNSNWRHDSRYDWHKWRKHHRSHFHLGFYSDPFGWDYFRYGIGWRLWPSYYRNSFWLHDPWQYRLPPAYGPYRWIRYFNDALLVNIYTGQVVDIEYNFFW